MVPRKGTGASAGVVASAKYLRTILTTGSELPAIMVAIVSINPVFATSSAARSSEPKLGFATKAPSALVRPVMLLSPELRL